MSRWVLRLEDREADRSILGTMDAESEEAAHERANRIYGWMFRVKRVMPDDRPGGKRCPPPWMTGD